MYATSATLVPTRHWVDIHPPFQTRMHRFSHHHEKLLNDSVRNMLTLALLVPRDSEYTLPMFIVEIPGTEPRPCIDYWKLNAITKIKMCPILNVKALMEKVSAAQYVSTLNLVRSFWQVPLTENASKLATFMTVTGTYHPLVLTFALKNAPFVFLVPESSAQKHWVIRYALPRPYCCILEHFATAFETSTAGIPTNMRGRRDPQTRQMPSCERWSPLLRACCWPREATSFRTKSWGNH